MASDDAMMVPQVWHEDTALMWHTRGGAPGQGCGAAHYVGGRAGGHGSGSGMAGRIGAEWHDAVAVAPQHAQFHDAQQCIGQWQCWHPGAGDGAYAWVSDARLRDTVGGTSSGPFDEKHNGFRWIQDVQIPRDIVGRSQRFVEG